MSGPTVEVEQPESALVSPEAIRTPRRWHVGTLRYGVGGLVLLFCWLLWGDFAMSMKDRAVSPVALIILRALSAPDWFVGLLVGSIPAGIGLILGPVISVRSDRHRGRWGRRIPFLLIPTPLIVLSMFGVAAAPALGTRLHAYLGPQGPSLAVCRIGVFSFCWAAFEIAQIVVGTLFGALINDVVPHAVIGRFFGLFRIISLAAGILFNHYLMGHAEAHFVQIFLALGLLYGVGFSLMCWNVKEGDYPPPEPRPASPSGSRIKRRLEPVIAYLKECYTNPFYLWYILATTLGGMSLAPVNQFSLYHARSIGMSDGLYGNSLAISYAVSLVLSYPLGILADRVHPLRLGIAALSLYAAVTLYGFCFATTIWTFFAAFVMHTVISGCYYTGTASIAQRLLPQTKFAEFASAAGLVGAVCSMAFPPALGFFIGEVVHSYRCVFLMGCLMAAGSVGGYCMLLVKFKQRGGDAAYVAPGT